MIKLGYQYSCVSKLIWFVSLWCLELESSSLPPVLLEKCLVQVVIIIGCSIVRNTAIIIMPKVCRTPGPNIHSRVSSSTSAEISAIGVLKKAVYQHIVLTYPVPERQEDL